MAKQISKWPIMFVAGLLFFFFFLHWPKDNLNRCRMIADSFQPAKLWANGTVLGTCCWINWLFNVKGRISASDSLSFGICLTYKHDLSWLGSCRPLNWMDKFIKGSYGQRPYKPRRYGATPIAAKMTIIASLHNVHK